MRIVDFDELDELWTEAEATFQAEADFDSFFAGWTVNLDELTFTLDLPDFSNSRSSDVLQ